MDDMKTEHPYSLYDEIEYEIGKRPNIKRSTGVISRISDTMIVSPKSKSNTPSVLPGGVNITLTSGVTIVKCVEPGCARAFLSARGLLGHLSGHAKWSRSQQALEANLSEAADDYTPEDFGPLGMTLEAQITGSIVDLSAITENLVDLRKQVRESIVSPEDLKELRDKAAKYDEFRKMLG